MYSFPTFHVNQSSVSSTENSLQANSKALLGLKYGVWVYFLLLIFEGALRKWVLPGLATPLLIVRDPIAAWILFRAMQTGIFKINTPVLIAWVVMFISFFTTLIIGHGHLGVALYGLRIFLLHFPLIFVFAKILDKEDVIEFGKALLWIHLGMTILVAIQFYSPQTAWVNRGVGGDESGSGFSGASGYFRVPGTFSFTNGLSAFYGFTSAWIFYFLIKPEKNIPKYLLYSATIALMAAIPLSISRSVFFSVVIALLFATLVSLRNIRNLLRMFGGVILVMIVLAILNTQPFFQKASLAFTERFESANRNEGGIEGVVADRFLGGMINSISQFDLEIFGKGMGMGTQAGAKLMTGGTAFLVAEGEWGRLIGEMGILLGLIIVILRISIVISIFKKAWRAISYNNSLPWMLLSFGWNTLLQGGWAQPTSLGFAVLSGGLLMASFNDTNKE